MDEQKYLTISQLTHYLKRKFDVDPYLATVYIIGEISNFRHRVNAHQYFSLKDEQAKIKAICFKSVFNKLGFVPEEGTKVIAIGRVSLYEATGEYQLYIEHMELAGAGVLFQAYKELRDRLTKEGLFAKAKKSLPTFPKRIALVTSPSGAVLHDIQTTIARRYPLVQLVVYPTVVQGKESADSIVTNLQRIEAAHQDYDLVIVARGGGSIEDLWSFNEEKVVRAIAAMSIPVISSIGHETDTTLSDFVADLRAATPTAAAEQAVPVLRDVLAKLDRLHQQLQQNMNQQLHLRYERFKRSQQAYVLKQPERLYDGYLQKVDFMTRQLVGRMNQMLTDKQYQFDLLLRALQQKQLAEQIVDKQQTIERLYREMTRTTLQYLQNKQQATDLLIQRLDLLSPLKNMARGYSYVTHEGKVVPSVDALKENDRIVVTFADGLVQADVKAIEKKEML